MFGSGRLDHDLNYETVLFKFIEYSKHKSGTEWVVKIIFSIFDNFTELMWSKTLVYNP